MKPTGGWTEKYRPKNVSDVVGEEKVKVFDWVRKWNKNQLKKGLLLLGPAGCGKTSMVQAIARELNYHLIETNASDARTKKHLVEFFGTSLAQQTLFQRGKMVLFDEVDGISGQSDRGAPQEIVKIISESNYPVILAANEFRTDGQKARLTILKKACAVVKLSELKRVDVVLVLKMIALKENLDVEERALSVIAHNSNGDLRSAINDFEAHSIGRKRLLYDDVRDIAFRDAGQQIQQAMTIVFKTTSADIANTAFLNVDSEPGDVIEWVRENMPREYRKSKDLSLAMEYVSRADVFRGRITRQQYWGYLHYVFQLLSVGVAVSKDEKYPGMLEYHFPTKIAMMAQTRFRRASEGALLGKLSMRLHVSKHIARQYLPLLTLIEEKQPLLWKEIQGELEA
ncbi:MAG: replication factor C large subunit [archaeon]